MKSVALILVVIVLTFCACEVTEQNSGQETTQTMPATQSMSSTKRTTVWKTNPDTGLQEYVSGNVILDPGSEYDQGFKASYRQIYYYVEFSYMDFLGIDQNEAGVFLQVLGESRNWEEPEEMAVVSLIKHFNIPKEKFTELVIREEKRLENLATAGIDIDIEEFELPNPDIIYTFDNDIINEYYRRA